MFYIVLLTVLGVLFLIAELLLLPGVSVGTILALVCYGSAIYLAFNNFGVTTGIIVLAIVLVLSLITTILALRAKTWRKLALQQEIDSTSMENPSKKVAIGSLKASDKNRAVYTNHILYKVYRILGKLLPHSIVMKICGA